MQESQSALNIQQGGVHYKTLNIQPVEYINANNLSFFQGNVVKYTTRYKDKKGAEDLKKAIHYLQMMLEFEYDIITDVSYKESPKVSEAIADKAKPSNPLKPWVPDDSGEWIEYDGSGQPVSDSTVVDVLRANERDDPSLFQSLPDPAGTWNWDVCGKGANIVAYKVCKD